MFRDRLTPYADFQASAGFGRKLRAGSTVYRLHLRAADASRVHS